MKRIFLSIFSFYAFSQVRWEEIISDENNDLAPFHTVRTYDNGQIFHAKLNWLENIIIKTDVNGQELWRKHEIFNNAQSTYGIKQNSNGEIIVYGTMNNHAFINYFDACYNLLWCSEFLDDENFSKIEFNDAIFLSNGNIIALTWLRGFDNGYDVGLTSFDNNGNLMWFNNFLLREKYPLLSKNILPVALSLFNDFLIISGDCYYANPENPTFFILRPMFIKTTDNFEVDWFLPYGLNDTIVGSAVGTVTFNGNEFGGYGSYFKPNTNILNSILMNFDIDGNETDYFVVENSNIGSNINDNFLNMMIQRDDTSFMASATFGEYPIENPKGEWIMDSVGKIYNPQNHPNTYYGYNTLSKTSNDKFYVSYNYYSGNFSIILFKFNNDLSSALIDNEIIEYDSLCNNLPIVSDTIHINNCKIVTDISEMPSPQEYYSFIRTIPLHISPNPATGILRFEMENTVYHKNIVLQVFDINGNRVFEQSLASGQSAISTSVAAWPDGLYIAVVSSSTGGSGSAKFVVKK